MDYLRTRKPVGGFLFLTVTQLSMVWWAYRTRLIQLKDLRVWFAAHELVARRCQIKNGQQPQYGFDELTRLVAGRSGIGESIHRLERVGLLTWDSVHIGFALEPSDLRTPDTSSLHEMLTRIPNHCRKVPVPRHVVRFIAAPCKRCVIATVLGHLVRCLYYKAGECVSGGFCKASWVSEVFAIDIRNVKASRKFLAETLALLERVPTPQSLCNRFGHKVGINLAWNGAAVDKSRDEGSALPPLLAEMASGLPPLKEHRKPLQELKHQKPASSGKPSGVFKTEREETPTLTHIVPEDLRDTTRLLQLFEDAQARGITGGSDSERLTFIALAERARLTATRNAPGLFAQLVRRRLWHFVTQDDEDRARIRVQQHVYGRREGRSEQASTAQPAALSQDALFVARLEALLRRQGYTGDVFAALSRERPEWTKARWDTARRDVVSVNCVHGFERFTDPCIQSASQHPGSSSFLVRAT